MSGGWDATIAMLILAFPEVLWVFGVLQGVQPKDEIMRWHSLSGLMCGPQHDPLLDGSGLRNAVRKRIADSEEGRRKVAPYIPFRTDMAIALDDEISYAYFNAYTAYRFGFRAFPVGRNALAEALLAEKNSDLPSPFLTFEDVYLNFPDNPAYRHYSDLGSDDANGRKEKLSRLEKANYRIFVTTEHRHGGDGGKHDANHAYVESDDCVQDGTEANRYGRMVLKPYSGMFALWTRSGLGRRLRGGGVGKPKRGVAPEFVWPPPKSDGHDGDTGHSAPGRLLQVAAHMIIRCEAMIRAGVHTVPDAVRCAVLTTDALELLGDRTPTTAMDALTFKHVAEVTAECQFSGVEYNIVVQPRLDEIAREARCLSRWFNHSRQRMAAMNVEMTTLVEMMRVFRDHGQFDEALICQNRVRHLHNRLWMRQQPARIIFWPVLKYTETVLASFAWFLAAIAGWLLLFAALFSWVAKVPVVPAGVGPWDQAFTSFTGGGAFASSSFAWNLLTVCAVFLGIAHIGIFISHVYMLVSRKD
jgi:hypothetical protein